jgi:3'-phosphoadenosine 5'-phosphosulfate sulfotransferase (PAPS reductase)/FAD synthetase
MYTERDLQVLAQFDMLIVSYSAGKDSTTCLKWALRTGKDTRAILANTGNEPENTFEYIRYVEQALNFPIEVYQRPGNDFFSIVRRRGMWPIPNRCLVSSTVKRDDFKWYLELTDTSQDALIIMGHRRSESKRRADLPDFAPTSRAGRAVYRPILDWSVSDVFQFLDANSLIAHPAYAKGRKRVGCVWCVNSKPDDLIRDEELYPRRCAELRALRAEIGLSSTPTGISQANLFDRLPICKYESVHCE